MMEVVVTTAAIRRAKLHSNCHGQIIIIITIIEFIQRHMVVTSKSLMFILLPCCNIYPSVSLPFPCRILALV